MYRCDRKGQSTNPTRKRGKRVSLAYFTRRVNAAGSYCQIAHSDLIPCSSNEFLPPLRPKC